MKYGLVVFLLLPLLARADDYPYLEKLYQHFHRHPELSRQEHATAARVATELRRAGFEVTENVGGLGVVAVLTNGQGPTLMLRTDLDALPVTEETGLPYASQEKAVDQDGNTVGIMHACGHDVHITSVIGAARELGNRKSSWRGTLVVIAQPAEEVSSGAKAMLDDGLFRRFPKPDFAVAVHTSATLPAGEIGFTSGPAMAGSLSIDLLVRGIGGHGASPHQTRDTVVLASQIVVALQTIVSRELAPIEPAVLTVGSIHGGTKHNIIPDEVRLQLTVRAYSVDVRDQILAAIGRISTGLARANGVPEDRLPVVTPLLGRSTPVTMNDPALTQRIVSALRGELGPENVNEIPPVMASEDFSRYGLTEDQIPTVLLWVGSVAREKVDAGAPLPPLHSPHFAPEPEPTLRTGVRTLVHAAMTLLNPH